MIRLRPVFTGRSSVFFLRCHLSNQFQAGRWGADTVVATFDLIFCFGFCFL
jgi:hypothetical protein